MSDATTPDNLDDILVNDEDLGAGYNQYFRKKFSPLSSRSSHFKLIMLLLSVALVS